MVVDASTVWFWLVVRPTPLAAVWDETKVGVKRAARNMTAKVPTKRVMAPDWPDSGEVMVWTN